MEEVGGEAPPLSAVGTTQTYIHQLRKLFDPRQARAGGREWLVTKPPGDLMAVPPSPLDAHAFEMLSRQGRPLLDHGGPQQAGGRPRPALPPWRGPGPAHDR